MNDTQKAKISRFLADKVMSEAVYDVLRESFLKDKTRDIHVLAASRLALDLLRDGWKELERILPDIETGSQGGNPGV